MVDSSNAGNFELLLADGAGVAVAEYLPWILAAAALLALGTVCWLWPLLPFRIFLWLVMKLLYRVRVHGLENVPKDGGAILVCNHVSYLDWLFVFYAQPRFIRFVIFAAWTRYYGLRHILRWARVIPIDASAGPRAIVKSLRDASNALAAGELVCIFAEGRFTRNGFLLPFHRGFEQIVKHHAAPVIPVCLEQVWGSVFSYHGGKLIWKLPHQIPYRVSVAFGKPLPATATASEVRSAVQYLSAECSILRADRRMPVHRQFVRMAASHPFRSCVVDTIGKAGVLNYGKVLAGAICLVDQLRPILGQEAMVGVWLPPSLGGVLANLAIALLGKTSVNLNYTASEETIQSAIRQCGIRHVLTSGHFTKSRPIVPGDGVQLVELEEIGKNISTLRKTLAYLKVLLLPGWALERWSLGTSGHRLDDLATVIFSSGSTGEPKGVMLTHGNIAANAESMVQAIQLSHFDRALGVLPFFHSFGYTVTLWVPLQVGASMVYHPDPRQARKIGELCRTWKCSVFLSTTTFLGFYMRQCQPDDFRSLRILMCGAEKLSQTMAQEFEKKFGNQPLEGYGCTELSPTAAANVPDVELDGFRQIGTRRGTIGQPVPGVAARIVDPETNKPLGANQEGMLLIYGANVMKGYLGKDEQTKNVIRDGWYVTGDIARIDEDGFITITGRLSRFAKIGGEMVPLEKIEEKMIEVLQPAERCFVVTCVPDSSRGERIVVLYTSLNGTDIKALGKQLQERGLSNLEVPGERDYYQVPELPVLGSGKLNLQKVKELALTAVGTGNVQSTQRNSA